MSTTKFSHTLGQAGEQSVNNDNLHVIFRYIYLNTLSAQLFVKENKISLSSWTFLT